MNEDIRQRIQEMVQAEPVVVFMKGNRNFPQCGFSATVVQILNSMLPAYSTVNVLSDPDIRQGIKDFSNWPTIPQLYVKGEFVGGCDIVRDMHTSGELAKLLADMVEAPEPPDIRVTDSAAAQLKAALEGSDAGDVVHLSIDPRWQHGLALGPKGPGDVIVEVAGLTLAVDPVTAKRAGGLTIDFVDGPDGSGFKMENPNEPAQVEQLGPRELKAKLDAGEITELFDVRTPEERALASIDGARHLDDEAMAYIDGLPKDTPLAFHCHHGRRSQAAADHFRDKGFHKLYNLAGGIDAWAQVVDTSMKRY
jgi:monothiol glutaredoxin